MDKFTEDENKDINIADNYKIMVATKGWELLNDEIRNYINIYFTDILHESDDMNKIHYKRGMVAGMKQVVAIVDNALIQAQEIKKLKGEQNG